MKITYRACAVMALASAAVPLKAEDAATAARAFGARDTVLDISLSPGGSEIAYIAPGASGSEVLYAVDLAGAATPKAILRVANAHEDLQRCRWATDTRLVCEIIGRQLDETGTLLGATRIYALDKDGANVQDLSAEARALRSLGNVQNGGSILALDVAGKDNMIVMTRQFVPESQTGTVLSQNAQGLGVEDVDITNGKRRTVESGKASAAWYLADENGTARIMATQRSDAKGYDRTQLAYFYRRPGSRDWEEMARVAADSQMVFGFDPEAVDSAKDVVYGFETVDGRQALVSYSLDGKLTRSVVLARKDVDVDQLLRLGRRQRVIGASFATEKRQVEYFDPELKALAASLQAALPGNPMIEFVGADQNEDKLLVRATSDVDPGKVYLFDKGTKQLGLVLPLRPELSGRTLAPMKPITFAAADGTQIPGYLTLPPGSAGKNLPAIVLPHGGPSARDEWGFNYLVQFFAARGYAVLQPNFRGSSGYGSDWFQHNGFQSWRTAIGDVNDAGRWLVQQGIADPGKLAIVGWSYGGYAALQSQVLDPDLFKAVVAIAPVTDLEQLRQDHRDYTDYNLVSAFIGQGPHVTEGSPAQNVARFHAPVLLFHGDYDQNVAVVHSKLMADRLKGAGKSVQMVEFPDLDHYIDDADKRAQMLAQIDAFLAANLK